MRKKFTLFFIVTVFIFTIGISYAFGKSYIDFKAGNFSSTVLGKLDKETKNTVTADKFGATGDGTDQTKAIQSALNYLESIGGGKLVLGKGTYLLSLAKSAHNKACLMIPAGVTIEGSGMGVTILKRLDSERNQDGILLVNKGYDTKGL